ncbi:MAG TPA: hydroxyacylglutathione hydrolase, partial [Alphaproteobacteria bacterium]|nr:hydroxyacylglutathione hydrolase [Alphaproteobacteria bacterium]
RGHIAFWFSESDALFCGDTLFTLGCGRLFEGTPAQMWSSLSKLRGLPPATRVFCGHEYTQSNARFAIAIDPDNKALKSRAAKVDAARAKGLPTVPATLAEERATNPFLRADDAAFARAQGLNASDPIAVFAAIRSRKDKF